MLQSDLPSSEPLQDHLKWLIERLEPRGKVLEKLAEKYSMKFICGYSSESGQGGGTFDADLLARLASFRFPLVLNLYPPGPIEPDLNEG